MDNEFDQNLDFIPLLSDSEEEEEEVVEERPVFEFDSEIMSKLLSLSRGIPIDDVNHETNSDPTDLYDTVVHNISEDMIREDTINATIPDYIHNEEYDENGNKVIFIYDSDDESEDEEIDKQQEQEDPPEVFDPIVISDESDTEEPTTKKQKVDVIELSSDEEDCLITPEPTSTRVLRVVNNNIITRKFTKQSSPVVKKVSRPIRRPTVVPQAFSRQLYPSSSSLYQCSQCKIKPTKENRLSMLSRYRSQRMCEGCIRLFECVISREEKADMIKWFATGKWPKYDTPETLTHPEMMIRLSYRANGIHRRSKKSLGHLQRPLISSGELMKLYYKSEAKCCISGRPLYFHNFYIDRIPYWSLSFDHITPIHQARYNQATHTIQNMQIMCSCLNKVKGHYSDKELKAWFGFFMDSIKVEID